MGEGRTSGSKSRRTDAVVISLFVIVLGIVVFAIALAAPWMGAPGNSAGLCAERAPWGTPENPPYPGPAGVRAVRSWWPIGVTCDGPDPGNGLNVIVQPRNWGPTIVAYISLALTFLGAFTLTVQLKRPVAL
ncbi:hypothetical protein [Rhodococcus baikonurensis]|uniref:Uncharacterized protein n=1 Tax=Rhodococcus baikonurensis TaxID=172041 RepID=A0ABV5XMU4_9NOCA